MYSSCGPCFFVRAAKFAETFQRTTLHTKFPETKSSCEKASRLPFHFHKHEDGAVEVNRNDFTNLVLTKRCRIWTSTFQNFKVRKRLPAAQDSNISYLRVDRRAGALEYKGDASSISAEELTFSGILSYPHFALYPCLSFDTCWKKPECSLPVKFRFLFYFSLLCVADCR